MRHLVVPLIGRIRRECVFLRVGGGGIAGMAGLSALANGGFGW